MTCVTARGFKRRWYKLLALTCLSGRRPIKFVVLDCQQESNPALSPREQQLIQQTAAHINNCSCTFPSTSTLLQSVWTSGFFLDRGLLLGLCWTKHSPRENKKREKNERRMPGEKGGTTAATMETQRGAKASFDSSLSQAFAQSPAFKSPVPLPTALDVHTCITLALKKTHTQTNERAAQKRLFSFSVSQQMILSPCPLKSSVVRHSAPPIIPSIMTSPPLRHRVFVFLERWASSLTNDPSPQNAESCKRTDVLNG